MQRILFPLITSVLFSGSYIAAKYTTVELDPLTTTLCRFAIALVILVTLLANYRVSSLRLTPKHIPAVAALGLSGIVGYHYFFFLSLHYTEVANSAIINALSPVLTALVAVLFIRERLGGKNYVGVVLSFCAVLVLLCDADLTRLTRWELNRGDLLMLAAVLSWTFYAIIVKKLGSSYSSYTITFYATLFGVIFLLLWVPLDNLVERLKGAAPVTIYALVYMGIFGSGIGYLTYNLSVRAIGATRTSSFVYSVVPVLVTVLAWVFFQQQITVVMIISTVIILTGLKLMMAKAKE